MAGTGPPYPPPGENSGPSSLVSLPPELLNRVADFLVARGDDNYSNKKDLQSANITCKTLNTIMTPRLFRDLTVTFGVTDQLPNAGLQWARPAVLDGLETSPGLGALVQRLQLRIEPFPSKHWWTDEDFEPLVMRIDNVKPPPGHQTLAKGFPPLQFRRNRQTWVVYVYSQLYHTVGKRPFLADANPLLTELLHLLPGLQHVQAAPWRQRRSLREHRFFGPLQTLSYILGSAMLLDTMPPSVRSYGTRCSPLPCTDSTQIYLGSHYSAPRVWEKCLTPGGFSTIDLRRVGSLLASGACQWEKLELDVSEMQAFVLLRQQTISQPHLLLSPQKARNCWQSFLNQQTGLKVLSFTSMESWTRWRQVAGDRRRYLDIIFDGVFMPNVVCLRLKDWFMTEPFLSRKLWDIFSHLEHLTLDEVVMTGDTEDSWHAAVSALPLVKDQTRTVQIAIKAPKYCVMIAGRKRIRLADLATEDALALERRGIQRPGQGHWQYDTQMKAWMMQ